MKKTIGLLVAIIMMVCLMTACQATPETPAVVNKNDGKLEEKIKESDSEEVEIIPIEIPEAWQETFDVAENVTISIDAPITGGDLAAYPVAEARIKDITDEQIDRFINYFAAGKKLFANEETKADMMRILIDAKKGTEVDGELLPPEPEYIESLEKQIASMPEDERYYIEPKLMKIEGGGIALHAGVELGNGEDAMLSVTKIGKYGSASDLLFSRGNVIGETIAGYNGITLKTPTVSKEEAIQSARQTLADLGFADMELATIMIAELKPQDWGAINSEYSSNGYLITFTREINGMLMTDLTDGEGGFGDSGFSSANYEPAYRAPWTPEFILVYADENGVQKIYYSNQSETTEIVADNVQLLPLEEIGQRAAKQIYYKHANTYMYDRVEVNIDRVVLGGSLINKKNDPETGIVVPAWHFFYAEKYYDDDLKGGSCDGNSDVLVINAIDGSVIDPLYMPIPEDEQTDDEKLRYSSN